MIERNVRAQTQIVNDLLDMSRIISGKVRLELAPTDLVDVIRAAVDTVEPTAAARGVHLLTSLDPDTGKFDEHKAVLGVTNKARAKELYLSNYEPGWKAWATSRP